MSDERKRFSGKGTPPRGGGTGPSKPRKPVRGSGPQTKQDARPKGHGAKRDASGEGRQARGRDGGGLAAKASRPGRRERAQPDGGEERRAEGKSFARPERADRPRPAAGSKPPRGGDRPFRKDRDRPGDRRPRPAAAQAEDAASAGERIAKRLARAGIASRRDAEALIEAGRVSVDGRLVASPAFNVLPGARITVDGTAIPEIERTRLFLFHKPAGVVTTNRDPEGRRTVFDVLPKALPRLMTIGRLDINTEGLLLLTNDGGLARTLELPATGWLRRYRVRVHGKVDAQALEGLKNGIAVEGVFYGAIEAVLEREQGSNAWLTIGLREGKNREVKNVMGALGLDVTRLIRVSYGPFQLGELPEGAVLELKGRTLRDQLGERLIADSGANFEAPVNVPFSNRPVTAAGEKREKAAEGAGREARPFRKSRTDRRDYALDRLQTRPDRPAGRGARPGEKDEVRRTRTANVWMAPGARPAGKKSTEANEAPPRQKERKPARGPGSPQRRGDRPGGPPRSKGPKGPRRS